MPTTKRKTPPTLYPTSDNHPFKQPRKSMLVEYGLLKPAKQTLHNVIDQDQNKRVYQITRLNDTFTDTCLKFVVAMPGQICQNYIQDEELHSNILEYFFGTERCPLIL